jgi:hypothetical protein
MLEKSKSNSPAISTFVDDPSVEGGSRELTVGIATGETDSNGAAPRNKTNASSQKARGKLGKISHGLPF